MRWDPVTIKLAVSLAVKCKMKGSEAVRKWLPLPTWRLVQQYRNEDLSQNPIDINQINHIWSEIQQRNVSGVFGLHWNEMKIRDGVTLCKRTGRLLGFEDLEIPPEF